MSTPVPYDETAACATCGRFGAFLFDGERLCLACYEERGSCCAESCGDEPERAAEQPR